MGRVFHPALRHGLGVNLLQAPDPDGVAHSRCDGVGGGGGARARRNPSSVKRRATSTASTLWRSFTLRKTVPFSGSGLPALICAFRNASPKLMPTPITSPVERISGPSTGSTPGNLLNGKTGDLMKSCGTEGVPDARP